MTAATVLVVSFGFTVLPVRAANEYYVSPIDGVPAGSDAADGSAAAPFLTFTNALAHASDGDTIWLYPGKHLIEKGPDKVPYILVEKAVRIKSINGPEDTYFTGKAGTGTAENNYYAFKINNKVRSWREFQLETFRRA